METEKPSFESLTSQVKEYINTHVDLLKLNATEKVSEAAANTALYFLLFIIGFFVLTFISVGAAFGIGYWLENLSLGFLIVAFFYIIIGILIWIMRFKWIKSPIVNAVIKTVFKNKNAS